MKLGPEEEISAQVILRGPGGKRLPESASVTSENIRDYMPDEEKANRARQVFTKKGFRVGNMVGLSFSITAPVKTFEEVFDRELEWKRDGIVLAEGPNEGGREYADEDLPEEARSLVDEVIFESPPDFGPTDFNS